MIQDVIIVGERMSLYDRDYVSALVGHYIAFSSFRPFPGVLLTKLQKNIQHPPH
jgi:hypothetical protein